MLEVDNVVCRDHAEDLLDAKSEGASESLGHLVAQGPQTTGQRAARLAALTLGSLARSYGGFLQVHIVPLRGRIHSLEGLLRCGLLRYLLPQL